MKIKTMLFALLICFSTQAQDTWEFKTDKQLHLIVGGGVSYVVGDLISKKERFTDFDRLVLPIATSIFIGAGKETYDLYSKSGNPSLHDFGYTVLGGVIGSLAKYGIDKLITKKEKVKL